MIQRLAKFITKYCFVVFAIFLALAGLCAFLATKVKINHDIYSYMPANSETSQGLAIMNDEFDYSATSSWQMMFQDLDDSQIQETKNYLEGVKTVKSVSHDNSEDFNREKDGHKYALYTIVLNAPADSPEANEAYKTVNSHFTDLGLTFAENGDVFSNNGAVIQIPIVILAIGCAMLILTIMCSSFVEPWLYLFAIMIAVLFNKGTNIFLPNVSHITDSISMVLQMALSMDYAIMLSSRYAQEKAKLAAEKNAKLTLADNREAMNRALRYSFGAISSSSLTTVVGLIILVFMSFTIGRDMGIVLSKGVILSLLSIFTTLPALLLLCDKLIEKTHKKTLSLKMNWIGKQSYRFRKLSFPIFLILFVGAFLLKGQTSILYTASENNKIKDIFPIDNQIALVYDNSKEDRAKEFCDKFSSNSDVTRVLCYSNTINEPEKYDEIIARANELSKTNVAGQTASDSKEVSVEQYLVKVLYYYYYRGDRSTMSLPELVNFIQKEMIGDERFADEISAEKVRDIERLSYFVLNEKMNQPLSKASMANLLEVEPEKLDELYTLYLAENPSPIKLTLYQFADFVTREVMTNPDYSSMMTYQNRQDVAKLLRFSNPNNTNTKKTASELANFFGLNVGDVEQILMYCSYTSDAAPSAKLTPEELVNYALNNSRIRDELGITADEAKTIASQIETGKAKIADAKAKLSEAIATAVANGTITAEQAGAINEKIESITSIVSGNYSYDDYVELAKKIDDTKAKISEIITKAKDEYGIEIDLSGIELPKVDINSYLAKLKQVYKLYEAEHSSISLSPAEFVDFLLAHKDDELLNGKLDAGKVSQLQLAQYIIRNQKTQYSYSELANAFKMDAEKLKLVYALYDSRHVHTELALSPKTVVNFLVEKVIPNPEYASRLGTDKIAKIQVVSGLMNAAIAGTQYDYQALYRALSPLSGKLDANQLFLVYLYHGSLYDYDDNWTLTIEQFVAFLNEKVLPDSRFAERIDDEKRADIIRSKGRIADAKKLLVGDKHSRALIETGLPAEGEKTFAFIQSIKDEFGEGNKTDYFVVGNSAMAYEMSQSFGAEMDFITVLTMISIFIVVAFTFKSILIPLLLVLVIQSAVYVNMAYLSLSHQSIYFIALIIVQAILMGATIDYAILYTSYYIEHRKKHNLGVKDAIIASYNKSIHSILTSASILIIVTAIVGNFASAIAAKICQSISGGTLVALLVIVILLPALLATIDKLIIKRDKR